ncbi:MAG: protein kinase [Chloroflexi bacterium]|nr:protein kinase [Chloroflexota bacterium]
MPIIEVATVACQTLSGLAMAHARGIIHRDIKPANIMVAADRVVKIMDFGIAKDTALAALSGSTAMGTPAYMAPEQFRGAPVDPRTDLYSLGVTLFQMLAGRVPFEAETTHGIMYKHLSERPPSLASIRADVPAALARVVDRALTKSPHERFQQADEMARALAPYASGYVQVPADEPPDTGMIPLPSGNPLVRVDPTARPPFAGMLQPPPGSTARDSEPAPFASSSRASADYGDAVCAGQVPTGRQFAPTPAPPPGPPAPTSPVRQRRVMAPVALVILATLLVAGGTMLVSRNLWPTLSPIGPANQQVTAPAHIAGPATPTTAPLTPTSVAISNSSTPAGGGCGTVTDNAIARRKAGDFAGAVGRLEVARGLGCDVVEALYDAHLEWGNNLADGERTDEAVTQFDAALAEKNGTEARTAKGLATNYRDGRSASARQSWDEAIDHLLSVQTVDPAYAGGRVTANLIQAYLGKGDGLRAQGSLEEAIAQYQRAERLRPDNQTVARRLAETRADLEARAVPTPTVDAPAPPAAQPPPDPTETQVANVQPGNTRPAGNSQPVMDPRQTIYTYYAALDGRRYREAYALLSRAVQQEQSIDQFTSRFGATRRLAVRSIDTIAVGDGLASAIVHTLVVTRVNGRDVQSCSRVGWYLVVEDGAWRRDSRSGSANEFGEPC